MMTDIKFTVDAPPGHTGGKENWWIRQLEGSVYIYKGDNRMDTETDKEFMYISNEGLGQLIDSLVLVHNNGL